MDMQVNAQASAPPRGRIARFLVLIRKRTASAYRRALIRIRENEVAIIAIAAAIGFAVGRAWP